MKKLIKKMKEIYVMWDAKRIQKEVQKDKAAMNAEFSKETSERSLEIILEKMREHEVENEKKRLAEEQELIRLGRIYKRSLHRRKYILLAAVLVLALSFGINSFGSVDRMFHKLNLKIFNREREVVDTDGVLQLEGTSEEEAFAKIEELYGFYPARLGYCPKGTEFLEMNIYQDIPRINILYGRESGIQISYDILLNYRDGSSSKDIEDSLINTYKVTKAGTEIVIDEYLVESVETRWLIQFDYDEVYYWITVADVNIGEIEKIVENLHLY